MAADLHDALTYLAPLSWDDVPTTDLSTWMNQTFTAGELLCNSVPPPLEGTSFSTSAPFHTSPNTARSSKDIHPSSARPAPCDEAHAALQKHWGKAVKFSKKDNPLDIALYKMAGHDRHGAWFARHNIMEGVGFAKMRAAVLREFPESLRETGGPGAGAKRGLGADRRIEVAEVEGVGKLEVFQMSGQMPPPVSPRDFITLLLTSEGALTEKSGAPVEGSGEKHVPRHIMIVSKPVVHSDAPERSGYVRGQYESIEMIREIPLHAVTAKTRSTSDLLKVGEEKERKMGGSTSDLVEEKEESEEAGELDPELNPLQWIMITRSDPGGGIPRFLVDRGTPDAMLGDVRKFLDWALPLADATDIHESQEKVVEQNEHTAIQDNHVGGPLPPADSAKDLPAGANESVANTTDTTAVAADTQGAGLSLKTALQTAVDMYAPTTVANYLGTHATHPDDLSDSSSDTSDSDSFMSAEDLQRLETAHEQPAGDASSETMSLTNSARASSDLSPENKKNLSRHEKEALKLSQQREKLEAKLAKKREVGESKLKQSQEKEASEQEKVKTRLEKEMAKTEARHRKDMEKLEAKREKELKKAAERRRKQEEGTKLALVARERDEARSQLELSRKENGLLSEQIEGLQRENTALTTRLGKLGGADAARSVREEIAGGREGSQGRVSVDSKRSGRGRSDSGALAPSGS